jgi:hypothetical protein
MIEPVKERADRVYAVKGISESIADIIQQPLPIAFEGVLLPFKDRIIYDGFMKLHPAFFGEEIRKLAVEVKEKAIREQSILRRLD